MELLFVDNNSQIDNTTRSAIRRHAAKGLNLGRKITRPSRVKAFEHRAIAKPLTAVRSTYSSADTLQNNDEENHVAHRKFMDVFLQVQPVIGDSVSILSLPIEVAREDRALMYETVAFLGSPRFAPSLAKALTQSNARDSMFVRLIFTDQAYYHCAMAVHIECTQVLPQARISAIRHISRVFRLVNERISNAQQVTNDTMAVVMSLLAYECTLGNYSRGMIHLSGLLRMIEIRGGLDCVGSEEPEIMQKIYRADLDYALRLGTSPRLETKLFENSTAMERLDMYDIQEHNAPSGQRFRAQLGTELCELWDRVAGLSTLVNAATAGKRAKLSTIQFLRSHVWLGHRLLNYTPLNKSQSLSGARNMAYLGLVTMISSFLCGLDRRVTENSILSQLIRDEANQESHHENRELFLWLLFLGAAVILQDPIHNAWLIPKTRETMQTLGLTTWDNTREVLSRFPWINDFYENGASVLFYRAVHYSDF